MGAPAGWEEGVITKAPPGWDDAAPAVPVSIPRSSGPIYGSDLPMTGVTQQESEGYGRGALETAGMVAGGIGGSLLMPGPGTIAGETAGFVGGRRIGDLVYGSRPDSSLAKDVGTGLLYSVTPRALGTAVKAGVRQIPTSVADKLYRSAAKMETVLKPQAIRKALDAAYRTKTTVSPAGQETLSRSIEGHLGFVDELITANKGKSIPKQDVVSKIDELVSEFVDMPVAKPYLESLGRMRARFILEKPDAIPVAQAQAIKRKAWVELQGYFKRANRLNATQSTIVGEQVNLKIGQALREGLEREIPSIAAPNKALGGELELQTAIDRAVGRISNKDIISIMDPLTLEAMRGGTMGPGVKALIVRKFLEWPKFKSYLAIEIANAAKRPLVKATPGMGAVIPATRGLLENRP